MMCLTFGLFTQVGDLGLHGPLIFYRMTHLRKSQKNNNNIHDIHQRHLVDKFNLQFKTTL